MDPDYTNYFTLKYKKALEVSFTAKDLERYKKEWDINRLKKYLADGSKAYSFNKAIKLRDSDGIRFRCIACGKTKPIRQFNAGHYLSAGSNEALRFNWDNVHGECVSCNKYEQDHLIHYRQNLVRKIGEKKVIDLELKASLFKSKVHKWSLEDLIFIRLQAEAIIKSFQKQFIL